VTTYGRLLDILAPFRRRCALAVLLSFLTVASSVALMATSAYLISRAALVTEVAQVSIAITCVRVFAILRGAFRYLERLVSHTVTFRVLAELRGWFFAAVEPLAPARLGGHRSGDLLARSVADIETLESFYVRVLVPPLAAALVAAFTCILLGVFAWQLALALLVVLIATGVGLPLTMRRLGAGSSGELVTTRAHLSSLVVDEVQGLGDLVVFDPSGDHTARLLSSSQRLNRIQERMAMIRGAGNAASTILVALAMVSVLWLAIPLVTGGGIDPCTWRCCPWRRWPVSKRCSHCPRRCRNCSPATKPHGASSAWWILPHPCVSRSGPPRCPRTSASKYVT
jgi:ATP-binding cassette subfamily C protein CydC